MSGLSILLSIFLSFFPQQQLSAQEKGVVYIIYGSDTAIWSGMDTRKRLPTYDLSLYTSPTGNAAQIMSESFRQEIKDSYGTPLIMTWWMMAGNIFRDGTNTNIPYANLMTLHLMKQYYGSSVERWGDELSLHYHTFFWSDYDGDGTFWWNQARSFEESRDDFDFTLAQQLIEEDVFPVSFRSGWHYMDNAWQQRLDEVLPFSMHNAYPSRKLTDTEPLDNVIDWSRAPTAWVPYHPDPNDYQIPGPGRGWNLRSQSLYSCTRSVLEPAFIEADAGNDQILCLWDHLPDANIFENLRRTNALLHTLASEHPGVTFRFVTGVEGMKQFLGLSDDAPPAIDVAFEGSGEALSVRIITNEPIFQPVPFVAVKSLGEEYWQLEMMPLSSTEWLSAGTLDTTRLAHLSVAATDTAGNLRTWHHAFAPADVFVDDISPVFQELTGGWSGVPGTTWGTTSRQASLSPGDSATVSWDVTVSETRPYTISLQLPVTPAPPDGYRIRVEDDVDVFVDSLYSDLVYGKWTDLGIFSLIAGRTVSVELTGYAETAPATMLVDVVRVSPLVPQFRITSSTQELAPGFVSKNDTIPTVVTIQNSGLMDVTMSSFQARYMYLADQVSLPISIASGQHKAIPIIIVPEEVGHVLDSAVISFAELGAREVIIPLRMTVEEAVRVMDNDGSAGYSESDGWRNSVVTSYGPTSRYVGLSRSGGQYARFETTVPLEGYYLISFLIPSSENATDRARYSVSLGASQIGESYHSQRPGGVWVPIGIYPLKPDSSVAVTVWNDGDYTSGAVLRADAIKISYTTVTPSSVYLIDNDSAGVYQESGNWFTSVAKVVGQSSRYAWVTDGPGTNASYTFQVWEPGTYDIGFIVPTTVNSATSAVYRVFIESDMIHSSERDQNAGSGGWVSLGEYDLPALRPIRVEIGNNASGQGGTVLRADAIRAMRVVTGITDRSGSETPLTFGLSPGFPNPFNPVTTLQFTIPQAGELRLVIHDLLGREVLTLAAGMHQAGEHRYQWHGNGAGSGQVPSGVYIARLQAGSRTAVQKLLLVR